MRALVASLLRRAVVSIGLALASAVAAAAPVAIPDTLAQRMQPCTACHGKEGRATQQGFFPRIAGKPAGYLYNQLDNFRSGRRAYPTMTYFVEQMSDAYLREIAGYFASLDLPYAPPQTVGAPADITAVATWLSSQTVAVGPAAADTLARPLPLACGSVPE